MDENSHRHEQADINALAISKFGIGLVFLCVLSLLLLIGLFRYFDSLDGGKPAVTALKMPPAPTLETTPVEDLQAIRAAEEQVLHSYGWVDQAKGVTRIPIERAIDLLARRGLPARPQMPAETDVSQPTESGLGQKGNSK